VCAAAGGQYIQLASSSPHRLNPFDLPQRGVQDDAEGQDPLAERVTALHSLLAVMLTTGGGSPPDARERAALDRALYQTYTRAGITADPSTHQRPAPLLRDLHTVLVETPGDVAVSLAARLEPFVHGSLAAGLFGGPTTSNWTAGWWSSPSSSCPTSCGRWPSSSSPATSETACAGSVGRAC
jgi:hypothetical protein